MIETIQNERRKLLQMEKRFQKHQKNVADLQRLKVGNEGQETSSFIKVKALVTDQGDPSVGIFPFYWEVECPFYKDADDKDKEWFRKAITDVYKEFADGRIVVEYDYEIQGQDNY